MTSLSDLNTGAMISDKLRVADTFWSRFVGLMGRGSMSSGEGLLLMRCRSIHTFFMRFPIDVAYLDSDMWVLATYAGVRPWRMLRAVAYGEHTLELPAGAAESLGVKAGHRLEMRGIQTLMHS